MFRYLTNLYVAKNVFENGMSKIEANGEMGEDFEKHFNVNPNQMKFAGYFEAIGSVLLGLSFLSKTFGRLGSFMVGSVTGVATIKHFLAGDGYKGAKSAMTLAGLSLASFLSTFCKK